MSYIKRKSTMWVEAVNLLEEADRLHRQYFRLAQGRASGPTWEPPVDIFEAGQQLTVLVALPGVNADHLEVLVEGDTLRVIGERPIPAPGRAHIHRLEIPYGRFERRIRLPGGRYQINEFSLIDGCLVLDLQRLS